MLPKLKRMADSVKGRMFGWLISHMIRSAVFEKNERNKVICCDFILEEDTSPQDEFELFKYLYHRKDSPFEAYYIINEHSAAYPEIKAQYGDNIIPYSAQNHVNFSFGLAKLLKTTKFLCGGFQVMHALHIGVTEAVKQSPYVYSFFTQHGVNFFKDDFVQDNLSDAVGGTYFFSKVFAVTAADKIVIFGSDGFTPDEI